MEELQLFPSFSTRNRGMGWVGKDLEGINSNPQGTSPTRAVSSLALNTARDGESTLHPSHIKCLETEAWIVCPEHFTPFWCQGRVDKMTPQQKNAPASRLGPA